MNKTRLNEPEAKLEQLALRKGWRPTKKGWPDFICFNDATGEIIAVEVKPRIKNGSRLQLLRGDQAACMDFLSAHGVRCFVSDGDSLEPYDRAIHRDFQWQRYKKSGRRLGG